MHMIKVRCIMGKEVCNEQSLHNPSRGKAESYWSSAFNIHLLPGSGIRPLAHSSSGSEQGSC